MSDALYERYKDALRRGHSAAQRGRFDEAIAAYAGGRHDRPGPGDAAVEPRRRPRPDRPDQPEALAAYDAALARAPEDEAAAPRPRRAAGDGRAARAEAADTLDRLVVVLDRGGSPRRRRPTPPASPSSSPSHAAAARAWSVLRRAGLARGRAISRPRPIAARRGASASQPGSDSPRRRAVEPKRDPRRAVLSAAAVLTATAETALDGGDHDEARRCYLEAAAAQRSIGNLHAALDACYQALAVAPAAGDVHLALTELYLDRGWRAAGRRQAGPARPAGRPRRRTTSRGPGCARWPPSASPRTPGWRPSAPDATGRDRARGGGRAGPDATLGRR